jgi:hypothetical protein
MSKLLYLILAIRLRILYYEGLNSTDNFRTTEALKMCESVIAKIRTTISN